MWDEVIRLPTKDKTAAASRVLLSSQSWVAKATGIELLAAVSPTPTEDAQLVLALSGSSIPLLGWTGKGRDPSLGSLAKAVAKRLQDSAHNQ